MQVETRITLLRKIADPADELAWEEFAELYAPLIYGFALSRGLQHADAADITQDVLTTLAKAMHGFEYDRSRGTFRSWLYTIVRRKISKYFNYTARHAGVEGKEMDSLPAEVEAVWDEEFRSHIFQRAIALAEPEFAVKHWRAFLATVVEGRSMAEVAAELNMRAGAVYVARHRVIRRLQDIVKSITEEPLNLS